MNQLNSLILALDAKTGTGYALTRIFLGLALTIRGWMILLNPDSILELGVGREYFIWVSLVGITHLSGGLLLLFGFLTRLGALIQIPILMSAIFFAHVHTKLMMGGQSLELAVMVLFLLCIYFIFGAGKLSLRSLAASRKTNF